MSADTDKNVSGEPLNGGRWVLVEHTSEAPRRQEFLPVLSPVAATALRGLLEKSASAPAGWYRLPGTELAVASVSTGRGRKTIDFDIRDELTGKIDRYRYDSRYRLLALRRDDAIEHPDIPSAHELPCDPYNLALSVAALADSSRIPTTTGASADEFEDEQFATRDHEGVGRALMEAARRVTSHWFGPDTHGWGFGKRFATAFVGSISFFLAWLFALVSSDTSKFIRDPFYQVVILSSHIYIVLFAGWFAWLASCRDQKYGPARLYLAGFLLPYFIWWLVDAAFDADQLFASDGVLTDSVGEAK